MRQITFKVIIVALCALTLVVTAQVYALQTLPVSEPTSTITITSNKNPSDLKTAIMMVLASGNSINTPTDASTSPTTALATELANQTNIYDQNTNFTLSQTLTLFEIAIAFALFGFLLAQYTFISNLFGTVLARIVTLFTRRAHTSPSNIRQTQITSHSPTVFTNNLS